jgi:Tol biopolymer transport system component
MTEPNGPVLLDLHDVVPDPPEGLLPWSDLERRFRRRRALRSAAAISACIIVTAAIVVGVTVGTRATHSNVIAPVRANGPLIFEQYEVAGADRHNNGTRVTTDLVSANPDGSDLRVIAHGFASESDPAVTPDGRRVAYVAETDIPSVGAVIQAHFAIYVVNVDGSGDRLAYLCQTACNDLAWSPDGKELAFAANGIDVMDSAGRVRVLCGPRCVQAASEPAWSPDGRQIAFSQAASIGYTTALTYSSAIYVIPSQGGDPRKLTDGTCQVSGLGSDCSFDRAPAWSPNGRQIAFYRTVNVQHPGVGTPAPTQGVFVMDADGSGLTAAWTCTHCQPTAPKWSPNGTRLAFAASHHQSHAFILDVSGPRPTTLATIPAASRPGIFQQVCWSPDGKRLALELFRGAGHGRLEVDFGSIDIVNADGAGRTDLNLPRVTGDPFALAWAPTG